MTIGRMERVDIRALWKHEERDFSRWLSDNLEALSDAVGFSISEPHREVQVGSFWVDLVAEDHESNPVIIENQLETTNHDHLGKILTYLTGLDAKTAIWVTTNPRPEHLKALAWLNEITPEDVSFYLVRVEAFRIGSSEPAPLFSVVVGPSAETKGFGREKKDLAQRHVLRLKFWDSLLALALQRGVRTHASVSPSKESWLGATAGRSGFRWVYVIWKQEDSGVELYIDTGDAIENKRAFDALAAKRETIERSFGEPLEWERLDSKQACRVRFVIPGGGLSDEQAWPAIHDKMVDAMRRFSAALAPHVRADQLAEAER